LKNKLGFFFLFLTLGLFSQERLNLNYSLRNTSIPIISFYVSPFPKEEIVFALERGFQSRFSVEIKIKEKLEGLEGLFGDRVHDEFNVFLIAEYDPFKEEYNIETYTGGQLSFSGQAIFLSTFGQNQRGAYQPPQRGAPREDLRGSRGFGHPHPVGDAPGNHGLLLLRLQIPYSLQSKSPSSPTQYRMETVSKIRQTRGFFSFFALLALYGLLVFLVITFSGQILTDMSTEGTNEQQNFILLITVLPSIVILIIMIAQFVRMVREQREGKPGARIKGRFVLYFILIGLLSSLPQGILATNRIDRILSFIVDRNLGTSLQWGL
jgi:hypothetical protein